MSKTLVPFVDLVPEWLPLKEDILAGISRVFDHGQFVMGPEVSELEKQLAEDVGVSFALTCSSGTTALQMALMALGIGPGDEVVLPAFTFAAPLEVVLLLGARPVLADIDPATYCIDVDSVARLITSRTKAIIAVSLYGQPADFERLNCLAMLNGLPVVEDAAQSYGATLNDRRSGSLSTLGCTSFFPTKPLGGAGDGGAVFTDDPLLADRVREIRDHGQSGKYRHIRQGINGRLDSISCAALLTRLTGVAKAVALRQSAAGRYDKLLAGAASSGLIQLPVIRKANTSAYAQYAVQVDNRERVADSMRVASIQTAVHYPTPLHRQPAYCDQVDFDHLPLSEAVAQRVLCLPIYPALTMEQQTLTVTALVEAVTQNQI